MTLAAELRLICTSASERRCCYGVVLSKFCVEGTYLQYVKCSKGRLSLFFIKKVFIYLFGLKMSGDTLLTLSKVSIGKTVIFMLRQQGCCQELLNVTNKVTCNLTNCL